MRIMQYDTGAVRLDNIKFFFFLVMTLSLPFSESIKTICLLTSSVFLLIQVLRREANIRFSMLHYGFIFLFLASVISSIFATEPSKSWSGSKDILFYSITFFIACSIDNEKKIQILLWGLYISTVLAALSGIFNSMTAHKPLEIHSLGNQNYTAMFFMIILTSMISTILFSDKKASSRRFILIIFSIITLLASAMTLMRASFLGLFAFILSLLNLKKPSRAILIFIIGFVFLTILVLYSDRAMWQKLFTFQSMISRLDIWRGATSIFLENPLTGVGLNHFNFRFPPNHPVEPNNTVYDAHSLYFQIASQMGLFGIISLIIIFFGFIKGWSRLQGSTGFSKALKYSSLGAFLVIAITGLFDTTLHHEHAMAFSLISGLTFGYYQRKNETL
ncbi:MAG: O-antigen ligase family protein [Thermodesulfovibrionales bacterium]